MSDAAAGAGVSEVAVVGAGFGGLALAHRLAEDGVDDVVIFERSDGVGGTWRHNTYPGAACDVPSHLYSLSWAPNPDWSRNYATQPEILAYIERCYDEFGVRSKVRCDTAIVELSWLDDQARWRLRDADGGEHLARVVVSAVGMFHTPAMPDLPGLEDFEGTVMHSARWDHDHDLTGERVAVVGTGASAIQVVPAIAEQVAHLDLYQRTPAWVLPRQDRPFTDEERRAFAVDPQSLRAQRDKLDDLFERNTAYLLGDPIAELLDGMARDHLEASVPDTDLREQLTPRYPIGGKRILISNDFYPTVQRDDVELVTDGIERVAPAGIVAGGVERPCDAIVACTGFRTTEYLRGIRITGRDGADLHERWAGTPRAYEGLAVPGFPNLCLLYGPNTNLGGNSILLVLEAQAHFVASALETMGERGAVAAEVRPEAMARYEAELLDELAGTVWSEDVDSYFRTGAGDIVTQLPHSASDYRRRTERLAPDDFLFTPVPATTSTAGR